MILTVPDWKWFCMAYSGQLHNDFKKRLMCLLAAWRPVLNDIAMVECHQFLDHCIRTGLGRALNLAHLGRIRLRATLVDGVFTWKMSFDHFQNVTYSEFWNMLQLIPICAFWDSSNNLISISKNWKLVEKSQKLPLAKYTSWISLVTRTHNLEIWKFLELKFLILFEKVFFN
jgi:hypothetical protein